jgi:hypothetical protein
VRPWLAYRRGITRAVTDADGRFETTVQPLGRYSLVAHTPLHEGRYRITSPVEASAGGHVALHEHEERSEWILQLRGLEAWRQHKLRFVVADDGVELMPDTSGRAVFPPVLAADAVFVFDERGIQIHTARLPRPNAGGILDYRLPPPRPIELRATGADGKQAERAALVPIFGAPAVGAVPLDGGSLRFHVAATEGGGERGPLDGVRLSVGAPRHAVASISERPDPLPEAEGGAARLEVALRPGCQWRGRLLLGDGKPARRARLLQWSGQQLPWSIDVDDDGHFTTHGSSPSAATRLVVELDAAQLAALPQSAARPTSPTAIVCWLEAPSRAPDEPIDLGDLRLDKLMALDVEVIGSDSAPAKHAALALGDRHCPDAPFFPAADARGRIRFLVPGAGAVILAARAGEDVGWIEVGLPVSEAVELRLTPWLSVEGVVKGENGQPMAGVRVLATTRKTLEPAFLRTLTMLRTAVSDGAGRFRVEVLPPRNEVLLTFRAGRATHSLWITLTDESAHGLQIVLRPAASR